MALCGSSFTLRGWADDETATGISASIVTTNSTNTVVGEMERSGVLWVEDLPLNNGANWVTLSVTNSAGLSSSTNFYVVQSSMTLVVTNISGDLWQPPVNVGGFVSDTTAAIYVNGMKGTNYGNGTWEVDNVPVSAGGVASFDVGALPAGTGDPSINTNVEKEAKILMVGYRETKTVKWQYGIYWGNQTWTEKYDAHPYADTNGQWLAPFKAQQDYHDSEVSENTYDYHDIYDWSRTNATETVTDGMTSTTNVLSNWTPPPVPDQDLTFNSGYSGYGGGAQWLTHYYGDVKYSYDLGGGTETLTLKAHTQMKLYTGGKAGVNRRSLFLINVGATEYGPPPIGKYPATDYDPLSYPWWYTSSTTVDPTRIKVLGWWIFGHHTDSSGNLYRVLPDNAVYDLNLRIPGVNHYNADPLPTVVKYPLVITANSITLSNDAVATGANFCVGQDVPFNVSGWPTDGSVIATNFQWKLDGIYVNQKIPAPNGNSSDIYTNDATLLKNQTITNCWWVSGNTNPALYQASVSCTLIFTNGNPPAKVNGSGLFTMFRPYVDWIAEITAPITVDLDYPYGLAAFPPYLYPNIERWLHFGGGSNGVHGIKLPILNGNYGDFGFAPTVDQLISSATLQSCQTNGQSLYYTGSGSDTPEKYDNLLNCWYDQPAWAAHVDEHRASDESHYQTFLMIQPVKSNGTPDGIAVPLRRVDWKWSAVADKTNGVWTLTSSNAAITLNNHDELNFPTWTNVIRNTNDYNIVVTNICR